VHVNVGIVQINAENRSADRGGCQRQTGGPVQAIPQVRPGHRAAEAIAAIDFVEYGASIAAARCPSRHHVVRRRPGDCRTFWRHYPGNSGLGDDPPPCDYYCTGSTPRL
jgi:hypothetical protein